MDNYNIDGGQVYDTIFNESKNVSNGGAWTHPIYSRTKTGGGFKGIFKRLKNVGKSLGKTLAKQGLNVALDAGKKVLAGQSAKDAVVSALKDKKSDILKSAGESIVTEITKKGAGSNEAPSPISSPPQEKAHKKKKKKKKGGIQKNKKINIVSASNYKPIKLYS